MLSKFKKNITYEIIQNQNMSNDYDEDKKKTIKMVL